MYKLTLEFKTVSELSEVVAKLGGSVEASLTSEHTTSTVKKDKKSLIAEAESLGVKVSSRDTASDIEEKIKAHQGNPVSKEPVVPAEAVPSFESNTQVIPSVIPAVPVQEPAAVAQPVALGAPVETVIDRNAILTDITKSLGLASSRGVTESQVLPLVQQACAQVGAPTNVRLSMLDDSHLQAVHPLIIKSIDTLLHGGQPSSFM
jgi:hypothetical protein